MAGFLWGSGGQRLSPDVVDFERRIAAAMMQGDYSPVGHWTQGLARVSGNILGVLRDRRATRAEDANMGDEQRIMAALLGGANAPPDPTFEPGDEAGPRDTSGSINPAIIEALSSSYVSPGIKAFAAQQYNKATERAEPIVINGKLVDPTTRQVLGDYSEPTGFQQDMLAAGIQPGTPEFRRLLEQRYARPQFVMGADGQLYAADIGMGGPAAGEDIPTISDPAEAMRLPPGTRFRNPQGEVLTVPGGPTQPASGMFP